jgi:hypothetical protein
MRRTQPSLEEKMLKSETLDYTRNSTVLYTTENREITKNNIS